MQPMQYVKKYHVVYPTSYTQQTPCEYEQLRVHISRSIGPDITGKLQRMFETLGQAGLISVSMIYIRLINIQ